MRRTDSLRTWQLAAILPVAMLLCGAAEADAATIGFNFDYVLSEGTVTGTFQGEDASLDGFLTEDELTFFTATASGTAFTGGPFTISNAEAVIVDFNFNISTLDILSLHVTNGLSSGAAGFEAIVCSPCSPGASFTVSLNARGSGRPIITETVTDAAVVPEPATLLLLGTGLLSAGLRRDRRPRG